ncbi:MAG TPA: alpha/beta fold hydrolase [Firmicutes bacterium]|nr:alpha/beta fold hydrolase [Bacillota bacterium]
MRDPVTFSNNGQKIIGVLHRPDNPPHINSKPGGETGSKANGKAPGVILFHGFTGQKVEAHRIFVKLAEMLASRGIWTLRFDFRGSGDSEGDFSEMTLEGEISDAIVALDFMCSQDGIDHGRVGILGLSMGGAVAACVGGRDPRVKSMVLWSAVADFARVPLFADNVKLLHELNGNGQLNEVDLEGDVVGRNFLLGLAEAKPYEEIKKVKAPVLIVHGDADATVPVSHSQIFERAIREVGGKVEVYILPGADHTYNSREWESRVLEKSVEWFEKTLLYLEGSQPVQGRGDL